MSSHNIDENALLKYICSSLSVWGITYINKDILKKARDNKPDISAHIFKLLFDICVLHLVDYQYTICQMGIQEDDQQLMAEFILAHLSEINCPYLIRNCMQDKDGEVREVVKINYQSSQSLLIVVGWLIAVSDFFGQIKNKYIAKSYTNLYIDKKIGVKQRRGIAKPKTRSQNTKQQNDPYVKIQSLYKQFNTINYHTECLIEKKEKLTKKLQKKLNKYYKQHKIQPHQQIKVQQLLTNGIVEIQSQEFIQKEEQLIEIITDQVKNMKNRQYFWMWMQVRVIEPYYKNLKQEYEEYYESYDEVQTINIAYRIKPCSEYLSKYVKAYKLCEEGVNEMNVLMEEIGLYLDSENSKKSKNMKNMLQKQIKQEVIQILQSQDKNPEQLETPSFIGIELKKYLQKNGFTFNKKDSSTKIQPQNKANINVKPNEQRQKLKQEVQHFISSLQQIKFL